MSKRHYTVGEVARRAHVTVRTLHHYDAIGLLVASERGENGYRRYVEADLRRLHEILVLPELGISLEGISRLVDAPPRERLAALERQRRQLQAEVKRTKSVIRALEAAVANLKGEKTMRGKLFEGFEDFDHAKYAEEAEQRWGETEAYRESARRTRRYGKDDWTQMKAEGEAVLAAFAECLADGVPPHDARAMDVAERHRLHISRWFYDCTPTMHAALGEMYVADQRFTAYYERHGQGLAELVAAAIRANAARAAPSAE